MIIKSLGYRHLFMFDIRKVDDDLIVVLVILGILIRLALTMGREYQLRMKG